MPGVDAPFIARRLLLCCAARRRAARSLALRERGLLRLLVFAGDRRALRSAAASRASSRNACLTEAILERVKRDDRGDAAVLEQLGQRGEQRVELVELAVDRDAQRLERARRRIDPRRGVAPSARTTARRRSAVVASSPLRRARARSSARSARERRSSP